MRSTNPTLAAAFILLALVSTSSACDRDDEDALISIMSYFAPGSLPPSWNIGTDCCSWEGVDCGNGGRVNELKITDDEKLNGTISPLVGRLSELRKLVISNVPNLVGTIPSMQGRLRNLEVLTVSKTGVSGHIPAVLGKLTRLRAIDLSHNNFEGAIPASLGDLEALGELRLNGNRLSGAIPGALFSRSNSTPISLDLSGNELTGDVPPSFGGVPFSAIDLSDNKLTGDASFLLGKSKAATRIVLARNVLSFDLTPVEYPEDHLSLLDISHNQIYGGISKQINRAKLLDHFDASYNLLSGPIPTPYPLGPLIPIVPYYAYDHNDRLWWCIPAPSQLNPDVCGPPAPALSSPS